MSYVCQICEKSTVVGSSQKHKRGVAGRRWKKKTQRTPRLFRPNLRKVSLKIGEKTKKMRICAKCLKRIKKFGSIKEYKNIAVV